MAPSSRQSGLIAAGLSNTGTIANAIWDFSLAAYNPDGSLDTRFGNAGKAITSVGNTKPVGGYSTGLVRQFDGKLVVAGQSSDGRFELVRYQGLSREAVAFDVLNSVPGSGFKAAGHPWHADAMVDNQGSSTTPPYAVDFFLYQFDANGNATLALAKTVKVTKPLKAGKTIKTTWRGDSDGSFGTPIAGPWSPQPGRYALTTCVAPDMNNPAAYDTCRTATFVIAPTAPTGTTASVLPTSMQWPNKAGKVGKLSNTLKIGLVNTGTSAASPADYFLEANGSVISTSQQSPLPSIPGGKGKTAKVLVAPKVASDYEFQFCLGTQTAPVDCLYSVFTAR